MAAQNRPPAAGDLVTVRAEKNPLDGRADFCADIAMSPLDVVLDAGFFCQCAAFFRIPSAQERRRGAPPAFP